MDDIAGPLSHIKTHAYGVDDLRFPFLILFPSLVTSNERYRVSFGKRRSWHA